jgi:AcrR family transcriptional regulator
MVSLPEHLTGDPVGRERLSPAVVARHQRGRVLGAAATVFGERGYTATTVDDLVSAAKIGVGSFYSLCGSKEECFLAICDEIMAEAQATIGTAALSASSWEEQISIGLRKMLDFVAEDPLRARIALVEVQTAGEPALRRYEAMIDLCVEQLKRGRSAASLDRPLPASHEQTIASGISWLLHRRIALGQAETVPDLYEELLGLTLEPYLGEERTQLLASASVLAQG